MPATTAEMIAWQLGEEIAAHPELTLQPPDRPWEIGMIPWTDDRLQAVDDLTPPVFFDWVGRGQVAAQAKANHA